MSKKIKMTTCKNCGTEIPKNAKSCPSCGCKNKKPIYKRGWFIALIVIVLIVAIVPNRGHEEKAKKFKWDDIVLCDLLPEPKSFVGRISSNSDGGLDLDLTKHTATDYRDYRDKCIDMGYTIDSEKTDSRYVAYNESGYKLDLWYIDYDKELRINLDAPIEMSTIQWPNNELVNRLPTPNSNVGSINSESNSHFSIYLGETPLEAYQDYVSACAEKGFTVDYNKDDKWYNAKDAEGYSLSLRYEGNNVMHISIDSPKDAEPSEPAESQEAATPEAPSTSDTNTTTQAAGIRPEFKEAMDSYEKFFDEYCDFMKTYSESDNPASMLADYTKFMSQYADTMKKLDEMGENDMNDAELKYYMEVMTRINQKLLDVAM